MAPMDATGMGLHGDLLRWYAVSARSLPWRAGATPWAILVCEVMGQQTPLARVVPRWQEWMARWPSPCDLAAAPQAEVLRAWDRMGYPRRALNIHRCAVRVCDAGGELPREEAALRDLPGIGAYTAAAVAAFAFGARTPVLDVNVRRVVARLHGEAGPPSASVTRAERARAESLLPHDGSAARLSEALMELGALVCTPAPRCGECPVASHCGWLAAGRPPASAPARRPQRWAGTDRQARGRILAALREADVAWVAREVLLDRARVSEDPAQPGRALESLVRDGLVSAGAGGYALGGDILPR